MSGHEGGLALQHFQIGAAWLLAGRPHAALSAFETAWRVEPGFLPAGLMLARIHQEEGRSTEAAGMLESLMRLHPEENSLGDYLRMLQDAAAEPACREAFIPVSSAGRRRILIYTDCPGLAGAEQCTHALACALQGGDFQVVFAQSRARHALTEGRKVRGIPHVWLARDSVYDQRRRPRAFTDHREPEAVFSAVQPELIIFADGCPVSNLAAKETAAARRIPFISIIHCVASSWAEQFASELPRLQEVFAAAAAVVAVSHENLALLRERFGLPVSAGSVILQGRPEVYFSRRDETARGRLRAELGIREQETACLSVGRLEYVKGFHYQLAALARLPRETADQLTVLFAGVGGAEAELRALALRLGVAPRVKFLGWRGDIPALLEAADIFILSSQYEGMPLAVMEAMAKGVPVMATAVNGVPEALGGCGVELPAPDARGENTIEAIADTLRSWAPSAMERQRIGAECRERAMTLFREERMLAEYFALIRTVMGAGECGGREAASGRLRFCDTGGIAAHRSGWAFALRSLRPLFHPRGVHFDSFLEQNFAWRHSEGGRPLLYPELPSSEELGLTPYLNPWVGVAHNPASMPAWYHSELHPQAIFAKEIWKKSAEHCVGLYTFSCCHARWLNEHTGKRVSVLRLPTEIPAEVFSFERFLANPAKKILQIGWWLRRLSAIYRLPIGCDNALGYEKLRLVTLFCGGADEYLEQLLVKENEKEGVPDARAAENTRSLPQVSNAEYDRLLAENVVFVDLYDANANNVVVECLARATPLLINPLPAVVEYLGEDYPLYFGSLDEAAGKALNAACLRDAHEYLRSHPGKERLSWDYFRRSVEESEVYQSLRAVYAE